MVAPLKVATSKIHAFVTLQQDWVVAATEKIEQKRLNVIRFAPENYSDGVVVPFQGKKFKIQLKTSLLNTVQIDFNEEEFNVLLPAEKIAEDNSELIRLALTNWMKKQALKDVQSFVELHVEKYNLYPRNIKIKTQKSRWGSCGIHNDININWLLVLAPLEVMEYVVVHELCHIKERNHSTKFWQLVEAHLPDYKEHRQWLKHNGSCLMQGL